MGEATKAFLALIIIFKIYIFWFNLKFAKLKLSMSFRYLTLIGKPKVILFAFFSIELYLVSLEKCLKKISLHCLHKN